MKPAVVALLIGLGLAVLTAGLGLLAVSAPQEDHSSIQRVVFYDIPSAGKGLFYAVLPVFLIGAGWLFYQRVQNWEPGQPDNRSTTAKNVKRRMAGLPACPEKHTLLPGPQRR